MADGSKLRVVQWATGNIGSRALQRIIEHPGLELVGLVVHSEDKAGKDAGEIAGLAANGVKATRSIDDVVALRPDAVVYMPHEPNMDDVVKLLSAGINIVTTRGEFHNPDKMEPALRDRIQAACKAGNSSIHSTGSSPGFSTEVLPLTLLNLSRRLDHIIIDEFADVSSRNSPAMLFQVMGFGSTVEEFAKRPPSEGFEGFAHSLMVLTDALGVPCDDVETGGELAVARNDVKIAAGVVPKGTVCAMRMVVSCKRDGKPFAQMRLNWYVSSDIEQDWDLDGSGWRVQIKGDTPLDVRVRFPVAEEDYPAFTPGLTAHIPVNSVPYVVAAEPGIRTSLDLPRIVPRFG